MRESEAAGWLARLEGPATDHDRLGFETWLRSDARNAAALEHVKRGYAAAGLLRSSSLAEIEVLPSLAPLRPAAKAQAAPAKGAPSLPRTARSSAAANLAEGAANRPLAGPGPAADSRAPHARPRYGMAAGIALAIGAPVVFLLVAEGGLSGPAEARAMVFRTDVGELKTASLNDGSRLTLDADSAIEVQLGGGERRAVLKRGRARLAIAARPVPFTIAAGGTKVRSAAGLIDVETGKDASRVEVLSGSAQVIVSRESEASSEAVVGQGRGVLAQGEIVSRYALGAGSDWTRGMLGFDGTELRSVAEVANRYSARKLIVEEAVAGRKVTGAFRAGDIDPLAKALAQALDLRIVVLPNGDLLLAAETGRRRS